MYVDSPQPSNSFVFTTLGLLACMLVINLGVIVSFHFPAAVGVIVTAMFSVVYVYALLVLHAGYHTRYTVAEQAVDLRAGMLVHRRIPLQRMRRVDKTLSLDRVIGWGFGEEGYCNRYTDGVRILIDEKAIYCSPGDVDAFLRAVQEAAAPEQHPKQP